MKKLITMTDYVLQQLKTEQSSSEFKEAAKNYANFLKQPLTLNMFIPTDSEGNVLGQPKFYYKPENTEYLTDQIEKKIVSELNEKVRIYKEAQKKVIFKNITSVRVDENILDIYINGNKFKYYWLDNSFYDFAHRSNLYTVEDIIDCSFELTDSAVLTFFGEK